MLAQNLCPAGDQIFLFLFELGSAGVDPVDFDSVVASDPAGKIKDVEFVDEETTDDVVDQILAPRKGVILCEAWRKMERVPHGVGHVCGLGCRDGDGNFGCSCRRCHQRIFRA